LWHVFALSFMLLKPLKSTLAILACLCFATVFVVAGIICATTTCAIIGVPNL
jgi:hypothetical protein